MRSLLLSSFLFLSLSPLGLSALAGPGHDHGDDASAASTNISAPRIESAGSELELVATAEGRKLTIYLDKLDTNEPADGATIEVSGVGTEVQMAVPVGDGIYELDADWVEEPGAKALTFVVSWRGTADLLNGTINIESDHVRVESTSLSWSAILGRPIVWLVGVLAVLLGFVLAFAFRPIRLLSDEKLPTELANPPKISLIKPKEIARTLILLLCLGGLLSTRTFADPGHDHADGGGAHVGGDIPRKLPEGDVFVPKASQRLLHIRTSLAAETETQSAAELVGTVIPDPTSEGQVQAPMDGKIDLAEGKVAFVGQTVKAGDLMALLSPTMPVYERGYLEQLTAEVDGKFRIAEQRLRRLQTISGDYVAQKEIEDTITELDSLREQKLVLEPKSGQKIELRAPVSGVISTANVRAGQVVNTGETLFQIVDPKRLWVEAIGQPSHDLGSANSARAIRGSGQTVSLSYNGRSPAVRQNARSLYFVVDAPDASLAIGEVVKVLVQDGGPHKGIVLPDGSVVRGPNGLPQIWVKVSAERFRPVAVRALPLDGANVLVTAGLESGSRVAVEGAELINQVR
jgi:cobalt-zinc-cadmium efflux system membrane fusion protein